MASALPTKTPASRIHAPGLLLAAGLLVVVFVLLPLGTLLGRVPWAQLGAIATAPDTRELVGISLGAAILATVLSTAAGTALALWLRFLRRGAAVVRAIAYLPLALPPVVAGLALSSAFGNRGLFAPLLDAMGFALAFHFPGVVLAHVFITLPFVFVAVDSALRQLDHAVVTSAAQVGMRTPAIIARILLPAISPAIFSGAALAAARSLGEFGTTLTFAGSLPGRTRTLPLGIYLEREVNAERAYGLAFLLILIALAFLLLAALPGLLRRHPAPAPTDLEPLDGNLLRELCLPLADAASTARSAVTAALITVRTQLADATVAPGSRTVVVGPNGSGKSTLVATADAIVLSQRAALPAHSTVRGVIDMITKDSERSLALLRAAGLGQLAEVRVAQLSGGQAALVSLVRALATRPRALVLDEPLAAVDVAAAAQWRDFFCHLDGSVTLIWVTHSAPELWELATDVLVLESARVAGQTSLAEFAAAPPTPFAAELLELNAVRGLPGCGPDTIAHWQWEDTRLAPAEECAEAGDLGKAAETKAAETITFRARVDAVVRGRRAVTYRLNYEGQQFCAVMEHTTAAPTVSASVAARAAARTAATVLQDGNVLRPGDDVCVILPRAALTLQRG